MLTHRTFPDYHKLCKINSETRRFLALAASVLTRASMYACACKDTVNRFSPGRCLYYSTDKNCTALTRSMLAVSTLLSSCCVTLSTCRSYQALLNAHHIYICHRDARCLVARLTCRIVSASFMTQCPCRVRPGHISSAIEPAEQASVTKAHVGHAARRSCLAQVGTHPD